MPSMVSASKWKKGKSSASSARMARARRVLFPFLRPSRRRHREKLWIFDKKVSASDRSVKVLLGSVPQEIVSHGFFSVAEVLRFHSGYYGLSHNEPRIEFLLDRLGLQAHRDKRVRQLSGGMKRRLLIAKALVHKPRLLLLDEPTAGVDVELRNSLWEFVRELNRDGVSILLTTHYLEEAESLCHRVGIIHRGELLRVGETKGLVRQLTTREITFCLDTPMPLLTHPRLVEQTDKSWFSACRTKPR